MDFNAFIDSLQPVLGFLGEHAYMKALVALLLSLLLANLLAFLLTRVIVRLVARTRSNLDDQFVLLLRRPLVSSVIAIGALVAIHLLALEAAVEGVAFAMIFSLLLYLWSAFLLRAVRLLLRGAAGRASEQSLIRGQTLPLFENLSFIIVLALAVYFFFSVWGIDMTAWLASAGIAGIAIGFAAKDTLANLFAGVFILADGPYKIGDYVVLDSGERGKVTHIGIRSTRLLTRDDVEVTIPNAIMGNTRIINESGGPHEKYRIRIKVGIAYGSDIDQVREVLMGIAQADCAVCTDPEPRVRFRTFGASGLDFELLCWVENPELRGRVSDGLNSSIYKAFAAEGIEIPYSKLDVQIKELPASLESK